MSFWKNLFRTKVTEPQAAPPSETARISAGLALAAARLLKAAQALGLVGRPSEGRSTLVRLANTFDEAPQTPLGEPSVGYKPAELAATFRSVNTRLNDEEIVFWCHRMAGNLRAEIAALNKRIAELRR